MPAPGTRCLILQPCGQPPIPRIRVDERSLIGTFRNVQAGGSAKASRDAARAGSRPRRNRRAAGANSGDTRWPGLARTATGTRAMISSQRSQRCRSARLSAPMSQTKRTPGNRAVIRLRLSHVRRVASRTSRSVTRTRGCCMTALARIIRSGSGAGPHSFNGLPGDTSHHTSSRASRFKASRVMCA